MISKNVCCLASCWLWSYLLVAQLTKFRGSHTKLLHVFDCSNHCSLFLFTIFTDHDTTVESIYGIVFHCRDWHCTNLILIIRHNTDTCRLLQSRLSPRYLVNDSFLSVTSLRRRLLFYMNNVAGGSYSGGSASELCPPSSPDTTDMSEITSDMTVMSSPTGKDLSITG